MKTYQSKLGPELFLILLVALGGPFLLMVYDRNWPGISIVFVSIVFVAHVIMTTYYQISGNELTIKAGFVFNKTVDITTIRRVVSTRNILSAPATSLDRLELVYNRYDSVLIFPSDKAGFIKDLLAVKADIEVKL
ncbi:PH domain-containing protein [Fibrella aestuarina]|uniref:PH domain-containing protein n=1 Tax=Fibrella aestuarina TaxID=651143 RepID=UPI00059D5F45|nr:PH domain-containing protein [Fibrella aestuarina]